MKKEYIFPLLLIALDIGAGIDTRQQAITKS